MAKNSKKQMRAVGYCRTSSSSQKDNTSIPNQKIEIEKFAEREGLTTLNWYVDECKSGSSIAGRVEYQQMMRDAANGVFDVVIVYDTTRLGRDGLDILNSARTLKQDFGVYVVDTRGGLDTRSNDHVLQNFVNAGVAESERNRIMERTVRGRLAAAEKNRPVNGKLPWGRSFNRKTGEWSVDPEKKAMIQEAAQRYLAGESMAKIAQEIGLRHCQLHKVIMKRSGSTYNTKVRSKELGIEEEFLIEIPPLLDDKTIARVRERAEANKTYRHGQNKNRYLLSRMIFCGECGYAMFGQTNHNGHRYYRHQRKDLKRSCSAENKTWIKAELVEENVFSRLYDTFGNVARLKKAIAAATPNRQEVKEGRKREARIINELGKLRNGRDRLIALIADGKLTSSQVGKKLDELKEKEDGLTQSLDGLQAALENIPTAKEIERMAKRIQQRMMPATVWAAAQTSVPSRETMSWEERRELLEFVFSGKQPDGWRMGVYIFWTGEKTKPWEFAIEGNLINDLFLPRRLDRLKDDEPGSGILGRKLLALNGEPKSAWR